MRKIFEEDGSYIEIVESQTAVGKMMITLCAKDSENSNNVTMVSVEMEKEDFKKMIEEIKL